MFKKAERKKAKLKLAITGPSGAGKTLSALYLASGLGKKIAVIDTENDSASLYSGFKGVPEFDACTINPPYTIIKYSEAVAFAVSKGYDVVIIDSISHAWAGEGGLLAKKESLDSRGGNSFSNWASITKEQEAFKSMLLVADVHLIVTMRSKQDYVLELNDKGKSSPKKVGLAPIQRDGIEYEFTTVFDIGMDHSAIASKDRTGLFDGHVEKISRATGTILLNWLDCASKVESVVLESPVPTPTTPTEVKDEYYTGEAKQKTVLASLCKKNSVTDIKAMKEIHEAMLQNHVSMNELEKSVVGYINEPI